MSGTQVRTWAVSQLGTTVGAGECFDYLDQALRSTNQKSAADFGTVTPTANYVWGTSITIGSLAAGDLIQFLGYRITVHVEWSDGAFWDGTEERPHHSAIVDSVGTGGEIVILEQNVPRGRAARRCRLFLTAGTLSTAVSQSLNTISDLPASGSPTAQVTIGVSGSVWYYRAVSR